MSRVLKKLLQEEEKQYEQSKVETPPRLELLTYSPEPEKTAQEEVSPVIEIQFQSESDSPEAIATNPLVTDTELANPAENDPIVIDTGLGDSEVPEPAPADPVQNLKLPPEEPPMVVQIARKSTTRKKKVVPPPFLHHSRKRNPFQVLVIVFSMLITVFFGIRFIRSKQVAPPQAVELNLPPPAEDPMVAVVAMNREAIHKFQNQNYHEALELFLQVVNKRPQWSSAHTNLGMTYLRLGRIKEAKASLLKAIELSPSDVIAYNDLGVLSLKENDHASAIRYFQKANEVSPSFPDSRLNLGKTYEQLGNPAEAAKEYSNYNALATADPLVKKMLDQRIVKLQTISRYYEEMNRRTD